MNHPSRRLLGQRQRGRLQPRSRRRLREGGSAGARRASSLGHVQRRSTRCTTRRTDCCARKFLHGAGPRHAHRVHARPLRRRPRRRACATTGTLDRRQPARRRRLPVGLRGRGRSCARTGTAPSTRSATTAPTASSARTARRKPASSRSGRSGPRGDRRAPAAGRVRRPPAGRERLHVHRPEGRARSLASCSSSPGRARPAARTVAAKDGRATAPAILPGGAGTLDLGLPPDWRTPTRCRSRRPIPRAGSSTRGGGCCALRPTSAAHGERYRRGADTA